MPSSAPFPSPSASKAAKGLPESAYQDAARIRQRLSAINFDELADGPLLIGSPETVARKVSELQSHGVGELIMWNRVQHRVLSTQPELMNYTSTPWRIQPDFPLGNLFDGRE